MRRTWNFRLLSSFTITALLVSCSGGRIIQIPAAGQTANTTTTSGTGTNGTTVTAQTCAIGTPVFVQWLYYQPTTSSSLAYYPIFRFPITMVSGQSVVGLNTSPANLAFANKNSLSDIMLLPSNTTYTLQVAVGPNSNTASGYCNIVIDYNSMISGHPKPNTTGNGGNLGSIGFDINYNGGSNGNSIPFDLNYFDFNDFLLGGLTSSIGIYPIASGRRYTFGGLSWSPSFYVNSMPSYGGGNGGARYARYYSLTLQNTGYYDQTVAITARVSNVDWRNQNGSSSRQNISIRRYEIGDLNNFGGEFSPIFNYNSESSGAIRVMGTIPAAGYMSPASQAVIGFAVEYWGPQAANNKMTASGSLSLTIETREGIGALTGVLGQFAIGHGGVIRENSDSDKALARQALNPMSVLLNNGNPF